MVLREAEVVRSIPPPMRFSRRVPGRTAYPSPEADLARWSKKLAPFIQSVAMMVNSTELASCPSGSGSLRRHRVLA